MCNIVYKPAMNTTHKDSQLTNDPNKWSDDKKYIIDLICKVTTVSVETVKIVDSLPELK